MEVRSWATLRRAQCIDARPQSALRFPLLAFLRLFWGHFLHGSQPCHHRFFSDFAATAFVNSNCLAGKVGNLKFLPGKVSLQKEAFWVEKALRRHIDLFGFCRPPWSHENLNFWREKWIWKRKTIFKQEKIFERSDWLIEIQWKSGKFLSTLQNVMHHF